MTLAVLAWCVAVGAGFAVAYRPEFVAAGAPELTRTRAWRDLMGVLTLAVLPAVLTVEPPLPGVRVGLLTAGVVLAGAAGLAGGSALLARQRYATVALPWAAGQLVAWVEVLRHAQEVLGSGGRLAPGAVAVWLVMTVVLTVQAYALGDGAGPRGPALLAGSQVVVFPAAAVALLVCDRLAGHGVALVVGAMALVAALAPGGPLTALVRALAPSPPAEDDEDTVFLPRRSAQPGARAPAAPTGEPTMTLWYAPRVPAGDLATVQPTLVSRQRLSAQPAAPSRSTPPQPFAIPTTTPGA